MPVSKKLVSEKHSNNLQDASCPKIDRRPVHDIKAYIPGELREEIVHDPKQW